MIEFKYEGLDMIFHPKLSNTVPYHFNLVKLPQIGFFDKILYHVFGKPNRKNYLEVLDGYIKSSSSRLKILQENVKYIDKMARQDKTPTNDTDTVS